jgi:hypothetical protein
MDIRISGESSLTIMLIGGAFVLLFFLAIVSLVTAVIVLKKDRMKSFRFADLMKVRDVIIQARLIEAFPEEPNERILEAIEKAFADGSETWAAQHLPTIVGKSEADRVLTDMERPGVGL